MYQAMRTVLLLVTLLAGTEAFALTPIKPRQVFGLQSVASSPLQPLHSLRGGKVRVWRCMAHEWRYMRGDVVHRVHARYEAGAWPACRWKSSPSLSPSPSPSP